MAHYYNEVCEILKVERAGTSLYGNPTLQIVFKVNDNILIGKTVTNAACGYGLGYYSEGKKANICYHFTAKGKLKINDCEIIK